MDVLYFLKDRTRFIRQFHNTAAAPFLEVIRKIKAEEDPYEPPYSEDDEPPFLEEWMEANTSLELLGMACVSMLSESLKLYFMTWERELGIKCQPQLKSEFKQGFLNGYKTCFGHVLDADWDKCPVDFDILEQVTLARNRGQHPVDIASMNVTHSDEDRKKYPKPFFVTEYEKRMLDPGKPENLSWIVSFLKVTRETLFAAIDQVEMLGEWLEEQMFDAKYPKHDEEDSDES